MGDPDRRVRCRLRVGGGTAGWSCLGRTAGDDRPHYATYDSGSLSNAYLTIYPPHGRPGDIIHMSGWSCPSWDPITINIGGQYWLDTYTTFAAEIDESPVVPDVAPGQYTVEVYLQTANPSFCSSAPFTVDSPPPTSTTTTTTTTTATTTTLAPPTTAAPSTTAAPTTTAPPATTSPPVTAAGTTTPLVTTTTLLTTTTRLVTTTRESTTTSTTLGLASTTTGLPEPTTSLPEQITPVPSTLLAVDATDDDSSIVLPVILAFLGGMAAVLLVGLGWWLARRRYAGTDSSEPPDG